jgi:hypothetical protein
VRLTASRLRESIYEILDEILETGTPVEIERKGRVLRIVPVQGPPKSNLYPVEEHPGALLGDPEDLIHVNWSDWKA